MKSEVTPEIFKLLENGSKVYLASHLPEDIKRGPIGNCFDYCILQAINNPHYGYVEGIAQVKGESWTLHAWLTDGINAFDPTWLAIDDFGNEQRMAAKYIGLEMPTRAVARFMRATGYQGVLANHWRSPVLATLCLPGKVFV